MNVILKDRDITSKLKAAVRKFSKCPDTHVFDTNKEALKASESHSAKLLDKVRDLPVYVIEPATLFSFMDECAVFCDKYNITYAQICEAYAAPYNEFVVHLGNRVLLIYNCPEKGISSGNVLFINNIVDSEEYHIALDMAILMKTVDTLSVCVNHTQLLRLSFNNMFNAPSVSNRISITLPKSVQVPICSLVAELLYLFVAIHVFSTFDKVTFDWAVSTPSGREQKKSKTAYRYVSHSLTKKHLIRMGVARNGKGWTLKHCSDIPRICRYLSHEKYRFDENGNELPIRYNIHGKPYYKTAIVPPHQRGKGLPKKGSSLKYKL